MAFVSATLADDIPRFQVPPFPTRQARRLAGKGLALGLTAAGVVAVLAVSLAVASVWTRAVSLNAPSLLRINAPATPLTSALGEWHRSMIRSAARSGPASGFGTAPDTEPQDDRSRAGGAAGAAGRAEAGRAHRQSGPAGSRADAAAAPGDPPVRGCAGRCRRRRSLRRRLSRRPLSRPRPSGCRCR